MKILLVAAEVAPFAKVGGLADVTSSLPKALRELGHDVRILMPRYGIISPQELHVRHERLAVPVGLGHEPARILEGTLGDVPVYFVDNATYFGLRQEIYGAPIEGYQFAYFCRAAAEFLLHDSWTPEVVHAHDWHTGLLPVLLNHTLRNHPLIARMGVVFTLHNLAYQGVFEPELLEFAHIDRSVFHPQGLEFHGMLNCLKGGLIYSDLLNTVSPRYAMEIQTPTYGEGLEGLLHARRSRLRGILNGIDFDQFNPETDPALPAHYTLVNRAGKAECKAALQQELGLPVSPKRMLVGIVSRLVAQKGFDLVAESAGIWSHMDLQVAVLGSGQRDEEIVFERLFQQMPNVRGRIGFDANLAQRIYGGSDAFLMPSRFEPCGLGQLIALRYGTIPIVRSTGGLADTIRPFDPQTGEGNGFCFERYDHEAMLAAIRLALQAYRHPTQWKRLVVNAMAADFSWEHSARDYVDYYQDALRLAQSMPAHHA